MVAALRPQDRKTPADKTAVKKIHPRCRSGADPEPLYRSWISWVRRSHLDPLKRLGKALKAHFPWILAAYRLRASNAIAENINSQMQAEIVRARGFQSLRSLTNIIFLTTGKLTDLPTDPFQSPVAVWPPFHTILKTIKPGAIVFFVEQNIIKVQVGRIHGRYLKCSYVSDVA